MLRRSILGFSVFCAFFLSFLLPVQAEEWKNPSQSLPFLVSFLAGLGFVGSNAGSSFLLNGSYQFLPEGFIPGIADALALEGGLGVYAPTTTRLLYGLQLRWDFEKNADWTFYAVGGVGGARPFSLALAPQFGVGGFWKAWRSAQVRFEVSSRMLGAGVSLPF